MVIYRTPQRRCIWTEVIVTRDHPHLNFWKGYTRYWNFIGRRRRIWILSPVRYVILGQWVSLFDTPININDPNLNITIIVVSLSTSAFQMIAKKQEAVCMTYFLHTCLNVTKMWENCYKFIWITQVSILSTSNRIPNRGQ